MSIAFLSVDGTAQMKQCQGSDAKQKGETTDEQHHLPLIPAAIQQTMVQVSSVGFRQFPRPL